MVLNFESITNSTSLELNSRFGNKFSNNLVVAYTNVADDRNAAGNPFPSVQIFDGLPKYFLWCRRCINSKSFRSKILTITDNFEINVGINKITLGTHNEFTQSKNVFFNNNFSSYRYAT
jgi:hypothetical protein